MKKWILGLATFLFSTSIYSSSYAMELIFQDLTVSHTYVCPPQWLYSSVVQVVSHMFNSQLVTIAGHKGSTSIIYNVDEVHPGSVKVRMYNPGQFCQQGQVTLRFWFVR